MELYLGKQLHSLIQIEELPQFTHFTIKGSGDLSMTSNKKGWGYMLEHQEVYLEKQPFATTSHWKTKIKNFYFTQEEIEQNFIPSFMFWENPKLYIRDHKLNQIIND